MNSEMLVELESFFMALADKTRLRLLNLMRNGEICVCFFTEVLEESQPKISRHLAYLRNAGLVEARRDGKWMHYSLNPPKDEHGLELFAALLKTLESDKEMQADRTSLIDVCCSPRNQFVNITSQGR